MADLLGATNRMPGYDSTTNNRVQAAPSRADAQVQNMTDPTRVTRADARSDQQDAGDALQSNVLRYDSNLQTFLEQLRQCPDLAQVMSKTLVLLRGAISTPGLQAGVAQELSQLLNMLHLDEEGFRRLFMDQVKGGTRFSGALFSLLRQSYSQAVSDSARQAILEFARRYCNYSSTGHIGNSLLSLLKQMPDYLPQSWRGPLAELTGRLENGLAAGARAENLALLQQQIIPFLGDYVERAHDRGALRALLNLLVLNTARYEDGAEGPLLQAFRQLGSFGGLLGGLNALDDAAVLKLLRENEFAGAANSAFTQNFAQTAEQAMKGAFGQETRESFAEVIRSMLLNESVYMPLNHMFFPVEWNGRMMYSELWVDPDAEKESGSHDKKGENKIQFLFKMDMEGLGFVEVALAARGDQVELRIAGPGSVASNSEIVAEDMREILKRHALSGQEIRVSRLTKPVALTQVFPNLFEGKRGVNVKV